MTPGQCVAYEVGWTTLMHITMYTVVTLGGYVLGCLLRRHVLCKLCVCAAPHCLQNRV